MKVKFAAATAPEKHGPEDGAPGRLPLFSVDYPKAGPVLRSSYIFPKVESYGVWKIRGADRAGTVSKD